MSSAYKAGSTSTLDLLLSSASFEELTSNIYYLDEDFSESDRAMIDEIRALKAELEQERAELEAQRDELEQQKSDLEADRSELEDLQAQQQSQLEEARAKQEESSSSLRASPRRSRTLSSSTTQSCAPPQEEALRAAQAGAEYAVTGNGSLADVIDRGVLYPLAGLRPVRRVGPQRVPPRGRRLVQRQRGRPLLPLLQP